MTPYLTKQLIKLAIFFIAACAAATNALAQDTLKPLTASVVCPPVVGVPAARLYGDWAVQFENPPSGMPGTATMLLQRHAEFSESLAGTVRRDVGVATGSAVQRRSIKAALAGDFEDGILILDESSNNISITGTWNGEVVKDSCGGLFKGVWKDTSSNASANASDVPFILRKLP